MALNRWGGLNVWGESQQGSFDASVVSVMPSMQSSMTVAQTVPSYNSSISSVMPSMVSSVDLLTSSNSFSASISSIMPSMTSSLSMGLSEPVDLSLQIISAMPSITSTIKLFSGDILKINNITISFVGDSISVEYKQ